MHVKGFLIEDDQGREFVMAWDQPYVRSAKKFALRGWQRRRLVPLDCPEQERRQIIMEALLTLSDLFAGLQKFAGDKEEGFADRPTRGVHGRETLRNAQGEYGVIKAVAVASDFR